MRFGGRKLLFKLILIGLLSGGAGCGRMSAEGDGGAPHDTDTNHDLENLWDQEPVISDDAARIRLYRYGQSLDQVTGFVEIAEELRGLVLDLPRITLSQAQPAELLSFTVSEVIPSGDCFTFHGSWPAGTVEQIIVTKSITLRTDLLVLCDDEPVSSGDCDTDIGEDVECDDFCGPDAHMVCDPVSQPTAGVAAEQSVVCEQGDSALAARVVRSETRADLCTDCDEEQSWAAFGGECCWCDPYVEMAPTPIPPQVEADDLPLPGAFHLKLAPVWKNAVAVSLLAEHDARGEVAYEWRATGGELSDDDQGGVVWTLPSDPGPHVIQVAVRTRDAAAVDTLRWRPTA